MTEEDLKKELEKNLEKAQSDKQKHEIERFFTDSQDDIRAALRDRKVFAFVRGAAKIKEEAA